MALIKCPCCKKDISDKAKVCFHCGNVMERCSNDASDKETDALGENSEIIDGAIIADDVDVNVSTETTEISENGEMKEDEENASFAYDEINEKSVIEKERNTKIKKIAIIVVAAILILLISILIIIGVNNHREKEKIYDEGLMYYNSGNYDAAIERFEELEKYKDSQEKIAACEKAREKDMAENFTRLVWENTDYSLHGVGEFLCIEKLSDEEIYVEHISMPADGDCVYKSATIDYKYFNVSNFSITVELVYSDGSGSDSVHISSSYAYNVLRCNNEIYEINEEMKFYDMKDFYDAVEVASEELHDRVSPSMLTLELKDGESVVASFDSGRLLDAYMAKGGDLVSVDASYDGKYREWDSLNWIDTGCSFTYTIEKKDDGVYEITNKEARLTK